MEHSSTVLYTHNIWRIDQSNVLYCRSGNFQVKNKNFRVDKFSWFRSILEIFCVNCFIRVLNFRGRPQARNYFNSEICPIYGIKVFRFKILYICASTKYSLSSFIRSYTQLSVYRYPWEECLVAILRFCPANLQLLCQEFNYQRVSLFVV